MTDRIIDLSESPAYLRTENRQLIIERDGQEPVSTPLAEVAAVVAAHPQVRFSIPLLADLMHAGGAFVVCDERNLPAGLMLPLVGNAIQTQRIAAQAGASQPMRKRLWRQIVKRKITAQSDLLSELRGGDHGLSEIARTVRSGDSDNREAVAANSCFSDSPLHASPCCAAGCARNMCI